MMGCMAYVLRYSLAGRLRRHGQDVGCVGSLLDELMTAMGTTGWLGRLPRLFPNDKACLR